MTRFRVEIYARPNRSHEVRTARAMRDGFKRFGIDADVAAPLNYTPCDVAVMWGHRHHRIIHGQRANQSDYLVMECGYIGDRLENVSLGFNGLNGRADFYADNMPATRGDRFRDKIKSYHGGDYYLVCGQVLGDASLQGVDYPAWIMGLPREINGLPVKFRPHPVRFGYAVPFELTAGSLEQDLAGAAGVITYNSNSAVDALLAGAPAMAADEGSMVYEDVGHDPGDWRQPDQDGIVNRLAWCQWTLEEIAAGDAWDHLRQRYDQH